MQAEPIIATVDRVERSMSHGVKVYHHTAESPTGVGVSFVSRDVLAPGEMVYAWVSDDIRGYTPTDEVDEIRKTGIDKVDDWAQRCIALIERHDTVKAITDRIIAALSEVDDNEEAFWSAIDALVQFDLDSKIEPEVPGWMRLLADDCKASPGDQFGAWEPDDDPTPDQVVQWAEALGLVAIIECDGDGDGDSLTGDPMLVMVSWGVPNREAAKAASS